MRHVAVILLVLATVASAHDVALDWSKECIPPGGTRVKAETGARFDTATNSYVLTAKDDRGAVAYRVVPGTPNGVSGLFRVACRIGDGREFLITKGAMVSARDTTKRELAPDGMIRKLAMDVLDVDADGPGGYTKEPTGHGPCIRIGGPGGVRPHTEGFATYRIVEPKGRYQVGVRYMDDRDDRAKDSFIRVKVGDRMLGEWNLTKNDNAWHERFFDADISPGDVLRIEARTDDSNGSSGEFCRISHIMFRPEEGRGLQIAHRLDGRTVTITQAAEEAIGTPALKASISLRGRTLRCHITQDGEPRKPAGFTRFELQPSADTPGARLLKVPYVNERVAMTRDGTFFTTYMCRMKSHCTTMKCTGVVDEESGAASIFGPCIYESNSADEFYPFNEILFLTASPKLMDVLPTFRRKPSSERAAISKRVVFDHWRMAEGEGLEEQLRLMDACGMKDLLVILHTWMHYGYDRKQPQFTPANPSRWTEEQFKSAIAACREMGYRVAVHENYNHMDWDSPYNSPTPAREFGEPDRPGDPGPKEAMTLVAAAPGPDVSRQPRNAWAFSRYADLRVSPGPLSRPSPPAFPISSDKALFYSQIESHKIKEMYGTTAGYLDVTPCVRPGIRTWDMHIDLDARNREARGWDMAYRNTARLFVHHRDLFEIATGEGGDSATYTAGYIHAVERQIRTRLQTQILPEFELRVVRPLSLHHGMGYYSRYFAKAPAPMPKELDFDLYNAMTIAFGHAAFLADKIFPKHIPNEESVRMYYMLRALQEAYADAELLAVEYDDGGQWITAEEGLRKGYDFVQARIRLRYGNRLEIAVNFDRKENWTVSLAGEEFVLPPKGWAGVCTSHSLRACSALKGGVREDFVSCPDYVYRHRRDDTHPLACRRAGLPGLSKRTCPGVLVVMGEEPWSVNMDIPKEVASRSLNLTVINNGDAAARPLRLHGFRPKARCTAHVYRGLGRMPIRHEVDWTPPKAGEWSMAFAYTYTDPGHFDEADHVECRDELTGPSLTVSDGAASGDCVTAKGGRSAKFVETQVEATYPSSAATGKPVRFELARLRFGSGGRDDDYADKVRLVLTHKASGETMDVPFPLIPKRETCTLRDCSDDFEFEFPASSVVTFELNAE